MVSFYAVIKRDSVFLHGFPFLCYVRVFSWEMSFVCRLKCPYNCFYSHSCFLVNVVLLIHVLFVLFLLDVISLSLLFLWSLWDVLSRYRRDIQCWRVLFLTYSLSISSLGYKIVCIIMSFLVILSICRSSSLVLFKNEPENLSMGTAQALIPLMKF